MNLQETVGQYAEAKETTKEAIADQIGMSRSSFFNKLRGSFEFSLSEAFKLSRILDVSLDDFYRLTQSKE